MPEEIVDQRLPYRVGFPYPLPVLPLYTEAAETAHDLRQLQANIRGILNEHRVRPYFEATPLKFQYRYVQEPLSTSDVRQTAFIECIYEGPHTAHRWVAAATKIRHYLLNEHTPRIKCRLELIDLVYEESRRQFPVYPDKLISIQWEKEGLRQRVINRIQGRQWKAVNLYFVTRKRFDGPRDGRPTVVIEAQDVREDVWWDVLLPEIRAFLPKSVGLELRRWREPWY